LHIESTQKRKCWKAKSSQGSKAKPNQKLKMPLHVPACLANDPDVKRMAEKVRKEEERKARLQRELREKERQVRERQERARREAEERRRKAANARRREE